MNKAAKRKAEKGKTRKTQAEVVAEAEQEGDKARKERFIFGTWDTILCKFLTELQESQIEAAQSKSHFALILPQRLRNCKGLIDDVEGNIHLAERIVNSLPCGHKVFYDFIREVKYKN